MLTDQYGSTWTYPATSVIPTAVPDPLHIQVTYTQAKTKGLARVGSMDAMHLSSARLHGADEIVTYEVKARSSWRELTGLPVNEPSVTNPQLDYHSREER